MGRKLNGCSVEVHLAWLGLTGHWYMPCLALFTKVLCGKGKAEMFSEDAP